MDRPAPLKVVVLGGGTAGWMTAASLAKLLPDRASVDLIESEDIGIIGVGEATLPHIRGFVERLGIREAEFMKATHATYKLGIDFRDFGRIGESYIHPSDRSAKSSPGSASTITGWSFSAGVRRPRWANIRCASPRRSPTASSRRAGTSRFPRPMATPTSSTRLCSARSCASSASRSA